MMFSGGLHEWWAGVAGLFTNVQLTVAKVPILQTVGCLLLAAGLVAGIVAVSRHAGESTVMWQRNAVTLTVTLVAGIAMLVFVRLFPIDMQFFALPFTFGVGCLLQPQRSTLAGNRKRREWVYTVILVLLFTSALIC